VTLAGVLAYLALWVGLSILFSLLWVAAAAGMRRRRSRPLIFDPDHKGCEATIGRLSVEPAREIVKTSILAEAVAQLHNQLDQLSHEHAADRGPAMVAEIEQYLQEER